MRKITWKHRAALVTVAMVMVGLAAGLGIATWQAIRASSAEQLAESRFQSESAARDLADKATIDAIEAARNEQAAHVRAAQLATDSRIQLARSHVAAGAKYLAEQVSERRKQKGDEKFIVRYLRAKKYKQMCFVAKK